MFFVASVGAVAMALRCNCLQSEIYKATVTTQTLDTNMHRTYRKTMDTTLLLKNYSMPMNPSEAVDIA